MEHARRGRRLAGKVGQKIKKLQNWLGDLDSNQD